MSQNVPRKIGLSSRQYRAIMPLITGGGVNEAAQAAGVTRRTITRWLELPEFRDELARAETETVRAASRRMARLADDALGVIESVMNDPKAGQHPRLRAAGLILDACLKWRESVSYEDRLRALEEMIYGQGNTIKTP